MFDCMQNDETPIIVINGGYTAFEEQLDKYGPFGSTFTISRSRKVNNRNIFNSFVTAKKIAN